jgi:hypothetical protein
MVGDQRLCDVCHYLGDMLHATKMVLRQAQMSVYSEKVVTGDTNILQSHTNRATTSRPLYDRHHSAHPA